MFFLVIEDKLTLYTSLKINHKKFQLIKYKIKQMKIELYIQVTEIILEQYKKIQR